jgi:hypothetical protein
MPTSRREMVTKREARMMAWEGKTQGERFRNDRPLSFKKKRKEKKI